MQSQLTEFLLRLTFEGKLESESDSSEERRPFQTPSLSSAMILEQIHCILRTEKNYKNVGNHKLSISSEESTPVSPLKCNCKKSKCLKLYCQCFSRGSFCVDCNCVDCHNKEQFSDVRAKAIDQMLTKSSSFGGRHSSKGCNCKKTGCIKKYCECYNSGLSCSEFCKCSNCENLS